MPSFERKVAAKGPLHPSPAPACRQQAEKGHTSCNDPGRDHDRQASRPGNGAAHGEGTGGATLPHASPVAPPIRVYLPMVLLPSQQPDSEADARYDEDHLFLSRTPPPPPAPSRPGHAGRGSALAAPFPAKTRDEVFSGAFGSRDASPRVPGFLPFRVAADKQNHVMACPDGLFALPAPCEAKDQQQQQQHSRADANDVFLEGFYTCVTLFHATHVTPTSRGGHAQPEGGVLTPHPPFSSLRAELPFRNDGCYAGRCSGGGEEDAEAGGAAATTTTKKDRATAEAESVDQESEEAAAAGAAPEPSTPTTSVVLPAASREGPVYSITPAQFLQSQQLPPHVEEQLLEHLYAHIDAHLAAADASAGDSMRTSQRLCHHQHRSSSRGRKDGAGCEEEEENPAHSQCSPPQPPEVPAKAAAASQPPPPPPPFWVAAFAHTPRVRARVASYVTERLLPLHRSASSALGAPGPRRRQPVRLNEVDGGSTPFPVPLPVADHGFQEVFTAWPDWVPPLAVSLNILHALQSTSLRLMDDYGRALHKFPPDDNDDEEDATAGEGTGRGPSQLFRFAEAVFSARAMSKLFHHFFRLLGFRPGFGAAGTSPPSHQQAMLDIAHGYPDAVDQCARGPPCHEGDAAAHVMAAVRVLQHCVYRSTGSSLSPAAMPWAVAAPSEVSASDASAWATTFPALQDFFHFFALTWASRHPFLNGVGGPLQELLPRCGPAALMRDMSAESSRSHDTLRRRLELQDTVLAFTESLPAWKLWVELSAVHGGGGEAARAPSWRIQTHRQLFFSPRASQQPTAEGNLKGHDGGDGGADTAGLAPSQPFLQPSCTPQRQVQAAKRAAETARGRACDDPWASHHYETSACLLSQRMAVITCYNATQCLRWFLIDYDPEPREAASDRRRARELCADAEAVAFALRILPALFQQCLLPQEVAGSFSRALASLQQPPRDVDRAAAELSSPESKGGSTGCAVSSQRRRSDDEHDGCRRQPCPPPDPSTPSDGGLREWWGRALRLRAFRFYVVVVCWCAASTPSHSSSRRRQAWHQWLLPFFALHWQTPWWWPQEGAAPSPEGGDACVSHDPTDFLASAHHRISAAARHYSGHTRKVCRFLLRELQQQQAPQDPHPHDTHSSTCTGKGRKADFPTGTEARGVARPPAADPPGSTQKPSIAATAKTINPWRRLAEHPSASHGQPARAALLAPPFSGSGSGGGGTPEAVCGLEDEWSHAMASSLGTATDHAVGSARARGVGFPRSAAPLSLVSLGDDDDGDASTAVASAAALPAQVDADTTRETAAVSVSRAAKAHLQQHRDAFPWLSGRTGRIRKTQLKQFRDALGAVADYGAAQLTDHSSCQRWNEKAKEGEEAGCQACEGAAALAGGYDCLYGVLPPWVYPGPAPPSCFSDDSDRSTSGEGNSDDDDVTPERGTAKRRRQQAVGESDVRSPTTSRPRVEGEKEEDDGGGEAWFVERNLFASPATATLSSLSTLSASSPSETS